MEAKFIPAFKGPIEGYVVNFLARNLWRISSTHEHGDAMSEAYIVFMRCVSAYPMITEGKHFMALFKTAWANEFNDLSTKASTAKIAQSFSALARVDEDGDEVGLNIDAVGSLDNDAILKMKVAQAPADVRLVLDLFTNPNMAPVLDAALTAWSARGKHKAGGERHVERLLGLQPGTNPIEKVEKYFAN